MSHVTRAFTAAELEEIGVPFDLPGDIEVSRELIDADRWSHVYELLFRHDGRVWSITYEVGATEYQEVDPFGSDPVTATAMEERQVTITRWMPIEADTKDATR